MAHKHRKYQSRGGAHPSKKVEPIGRRLRDLPCDVFHLILTSLSWRDSRALSLVSHDMREWTHGSHRAEWHTAELLARNLDQLLHQLILRRVDRCFQTSSPPNLAIFVLSTGNAEKSVRELRKGKWWHDLHHALEKHELLPSACQVLCLYAPKGLALVNGVAHPEPHASYHLGVSVGYLPSATLQVFNVNRRDARNVIQPLLRPALRHVNAFLVFGSSFTCSRLITQRLEQEYPHTGILGGVFPYTDTAEPLAYRSHDQRTVVLGKNLVLAIGGQVGLLPVVAHGYRAISPVLQHLDVESVNNDLLLDSIESSYDEQYFVYRRVRNLNSNDAMSPQEAMLDFGYDPHERQDQPLYFIPSAPASETIIPMFISSNSSAICSVKQPWDPREVGQLYTTGVHEALVDTQASLESARSTLATSQRIIGALGFTCASRNAAFFQGQVQMESQLFGSTFPKIPALLASCESEIGPIPPRGGFVTQEQYLNPRHDLPTHHLLNHSLSMAVFYIPAPAPVPAPAGAPASASANH